MNPGANGWYIAANDGQARGPFERNELLALRVAGQLADDALVWTLELAEWVPLRRALPPSTAAAAQLLATKTRAIQSIPSLVTAKAANGDRPAPPVPIPQGDARVQGTPRASPSADLNMQQRIAAEAATANAIQLKSQRFVWGLRRLLARNIDFAVLGGLSWAITSLILLKLGGNALPAPLSAFEQLSILVVIFLCVLALPLEALLLGVTGFTPGKFALGLRVVSSASGAPGILRAFKRALDVFVRGQGLMLGPISLIASVIALQRLLSEGRTRWDERLGTAVEYAPLSANLWWVALAVAALAYAALADNLFTKLVWALS